MFNLTGSLAESQASFLVSSEVPPPPHHRTHVSLMYIMVCSLTIVMTYVIEQ